MTPAPGAGRDFEEFYVDHHRELARLAYLATGDHEIADDIAAEALLVIWKKWDRIGEIEHPTAYVRRTVLNIATSTIRSRVRERRGLVALVSRLEQHAPATDGAAVLDVRAALLELPPGRRACVILRYALDLSVEEVAATLQIRVGTVKSQTSKGIAQLRTKLGGITDTVDGRMLLPLWRPYDELP